MATTTYGTEYVQSSDLVSNWPGSSLNVANRIDDVSLKGNGLNNQTGTSYTLVLTDGGKNVTLNNASAVSLTVPTNASVAFPTGTGIGLVNKGAGLVTVAGAGGVTVSGASLTLSQNETAVLIKLDTNSWVMSKGGGIPKASYSATTGSPSITTVSGKTCVQFTGSGSITTTAGQVEVLVVGAGMNAQSGYTWPDARAGGDAGKVAYGIFELTAATHTITVGAAATRPTVPGSSSIGTIVSAGGGNGANSAAGGGANNYGIASSITGSNLEYSYINGSSDPAVTDSGYGQASALNTTSGAGNGIVIMLFG